jgi:hypothetical protein
LLGWQKQTNPTVLAQNLDKFKILARLIELACERTPTPSPFFGLEALTTL